MTRKLPTFPGLCVVVFLVLACAVDVGAQSAQVPARITLPIDETSLVTLHGNTHPLARAEFDQGAVPASLPMKRMLLILQRSPEQESALGQLLQQQQDNSSPSYHKWVTPEQFGAQFGPAPQDIQSITSWLESRGFQVTGASRGGILIEFSGTAGQVQEAFHTQIRKYAVDGEEHYANASDPMVPAGLVPMVAGLRALNNFPAKPMNHSAGTFHRDKDSGKIVPTKPLPIPQFTPGSGFRCGILGGTCETLGPFDLATIYNYAPLWNGSAPIDGTGQTIAIVGETDINPADWSAFWNLFGVAQPKGMLNIIHNGPDPGIQEDESEADIDTQWSSAVAKGATIDLVVSQTTETTLGVDLSAEYIVDNNLAPVMSESYGICEFFIGTTGNTFYNQLWQQASAQGITVFISSGDQGSAACDRGEPSASFGLTVSGFESTPYNVSVGGTDFNDLTTTVTYWNSFNSANESNAKGYIPEVTWNDSCTNSEIFSYIGATTAEQACNNSEAQQAGFLAVAGGSGGASNCTSFTTTSPISCSGGYAKPPWQNVAGVPADGKRDVPDVSLFASNGFNNSFYIVCQSDETTTCDLKTGSISGFGGTSVSSPAFAGIMALVNQKTGERQGNANYVFYKMAATAANNCNSGTVSSTGTNKCIFYDIPTGSTIAMPCMAGSPSCTVTTAGDQNGVLSGFAAGTGYDLATGLGSVNVENLVNQWSTYAGQFKGTKFSSFALGPPATITHGQPIAVAATVVPQSGTGTPTGTISLIAKAGTSASQQQGLPQIFTLSSGSVPANSTTDFLPGGTSYTVTAEYSGDETFAASTSLPVTVTVNPEASKTQIAIPTFDVTTGLQTNPNATTFVFGSPYLLRSNVTNSSGNPCATNGIETYGCPTGSVSITDTFNGVTGPLDSGTYALNNEGYGEDQTISLLAGQHKFAASYGGDKSYLASANTSVPDVVAVTPAPTNTGGQGSFPAPLIIGSAFSVSTQAITVNPGTYPVPPGGTFTIFDGSTKLAATVTTIPGIVSTKSSLVYEVLGGNIQFTVPGPSGAHSLSVAYSGDSNYGPSNSGAFAVNVAYSTTTNITSSALTVQHGASVTFTAAITPNLAGGPAMTGTVMFTSNGLQLGPPIALMNGQAQISTSTLAGGSDQIFAVYSGDANYDASSSNLTETVQLLGTTTSVTTSNAAIQAGTSVTLKALVAPTQTGGPTLTGSVQFFSAITVEGGDNPLGNGTVVANGQAQLVTNSIPAGTQLIFALYSGDTNYQNSTGSTAEVVTAAPTFMVTANPSSIMVPKQGSSGTTTLTFSAMNGYSGTIPLSPALCAGLPAETTCSFSVASVALSSTVTTATATLTFQTTAASVAAPPPDSPRFTPGFPLWALAGAALACIAGVGFLLAGNFSTRQRWNSALTLFALTLMLAISSCGGSSGGGGGGGGVVTNPGTPVGVDGGVVLTFSGAGITPAPTLNISINVE